MSKKLEKEKECDNCPGRKYPAGEYCQGCEMKCYRIDGSRPKGYIKSAMIMNEEEFNEFSTEDLIERFKKSLKGIRKAYDISVVTFEGDKEVFVLSEKGYEWQWEEQKIKRTKVNVLKSDVLLVTWNFLFNRPLWFVYDPDNPPEGIREILESRKKYEMKGSIRMTDESHLMSKGRNMDHHLDIYHKKRKKK